MSVSRCSWLSGSYRNCLLCEPSIVEGMCKEPTQALSNSKNGSELLPTWTHNATSPGPGLVVGNSRCQPGFQPHPRGPVGKQGAGISLLRDAPASPPPPAPSGPSLRWAGNPCPPYSARPSCEHADSRGEQVLDRTPAPSPDPRPEGGRGESGAAGGGFPGPGRRHLSTPILGTAPPWEGAAARLPQTTSCPALGWGGPSHPAARPPSRRPNFPAEVCSLLGPGRGSAQPPDGRR